MKKRAILLLLAALLLCALPMSASAAGSARLVRAFVHDGVLTTYVVFDGMEKPVTSAEAKVNGGIYPATARLETVAQAGKPVTWLLLVDASTSMPQFREEMAAFAGKLAEGAGEKTRFLLAAFGKEYRLVNGGVAAAELAGEIRSMGLADRATRLHSGIQAAMDELEAIPREGNELRAIVVLTDAVVEVDPDSAAQYEKLLERLRASDVMLHSVGFGKDAAALESLASLVDASDGVSQVIGDVSAESAAETLQSVTGAMSITGFDLRGASLSGDQTVSVTFAAGAELICRAETTLHLPDDGVPAAPEDPPEAPDQPDQPDDLEPPTDEPGGAEPTEPPEESPVAEPPEPSEEPPAGSEGTPDEPAEPPAEEEESPKLWVILAVAGGAVLVLLAALLLLLLGKKKKKAAPPPMSVPETIPPMPMRSIFLRIEVLSGTFAGATTEFILEDALTIGSGESCPIRFLEDGVADRHAQLRFTGSAVLLEDLGSPTGTFLDDAPVTAPERLRSGMVIRVGGGTFRARF